MEKYVHTTRFVFSFHFYIQKKKKSLGFLKSGVLQLGPFISWSEKPLDGKRTSVATKSA